MEEDSAPLIQQKRSDTTIGSEGRVREVKRGETKKKECGEGQI
jgi:hypothetical protein